MIRCGYCLEPVIIDKLLISENFKFSPETIYLRHISDSQTTGCHKKSVYLELNDTEELLESDVAWFQNLYCSY